MSKWIRADLCSAIFAVGLMLLLANALLIGHGGWKIFRLREIADPEWRIAMYAPLRDLMIGVWGMACSLTGGIGSLLACKFGRRQPISAETDARREEG
jgi:hypothetical protein